MADSALTALKRHLWYVTEELAVLSLFSSKISIEQKAKMADKLLGLQPEEKLTSPSM